MNFANYWEKIEAYINTINHAIIAVVTVYITFTCWNVGATNFSFHVWCCCIGYHLLMAEAIIGIYQGNTWSRLHSRRSRHNIHWIMQAVGTTLSISGVLLQWLAYGKHHYENYHAHLGFVSIIFMMIAFLNGTLALWAPEIRRWIKPVYSKFFHNVIGIVAFAVGMASISYGYDLHDFANRSTLQIRHALKWAAYITAVLSLIGAVRSLYGQAKGVILTTKNSLSSSSSELPLKN